MPRRRSLCVAFAFLLCTSVVFAQRDLGTVTGTVTDPQGSAVPNAKVTLTNDATGVASDTTTNDSGSYTRPALNPGTYTITVEAAGFQKAEQKGIIVNPSTPTSVDISLLVGNATQTVEVTASAPLLQTESPAIGANLNSSQVSELPLGGQRTFTFLARLSPGVVPAEPGARDALGGGFSANGVRSTGENNFLLNGVDNNVNVIDFINQTSFVIGPSVEAIGNMQILTNGYSAEYGRAAGGVLDISLKSGTNQVHGVGFELLQNTDLDANTWENNKAGVPRNKFIQNQFGGAMGAPIIKNRLFVFGDYQGTRIRTAGGAVQNLGYGQYFTIPTPAMVQGDFSRLLGGSIGTINGTNVLQNEIFDPTTTTCLSGCLPGTLTGNGSGNPIYSRNPFPGNKMPITSMDPAAYKIASLFPAPNQPVLTGTFPQNDYYIVTPGTLNQDQGDARVDFNLNEHNSIFGTISWSNTNKTSGQPLPGALDGGNFYGVGEQDLGRNGMISWTHIFSPTLVNEARVGFTRLVTARLQGNASTDEYKAYGIGGYDPTIPLNGGLMQTNPGRYSQFGANNWLPTKEYSNEWDFIENLAVTKGVHSMKFGVEFRPFHFPFFQVPYPHGQMGFALTETAYPSNVKDSGKNGTFSADTGDEMASYLLGAIDTAQISTTNFISSTKQAYAFYGLDTWKVNPKLTLTLGLRYELFSPIGEQFARQSNYVQQDATLYIPSGPNQNAPLPPNFNTPATVNGVTFPALFPNVAVSRGKVGPYLIPWDKTDAGPRVGFAYNPRPKTVVRGSYGIFYGGEENQGGNPNRGESAPFNSSPALDRPAGVGSFQPNPLLANGNPTGGLTVGYPINVFNGFPVSSLQFREVEPNFRNPMIQSWNLAVQQELPAQMALTVGYVGNHQSHQLFQPDFNACPNVFTANPNINCNALRLYPDVGSVSGTSTFGIGNYEGLTVQLEKRLTVGLQFTAAYTYGHALSNTGTTLSGSPGFNQLDPSNIDRSYSSAAWDIRNSFVLAGNYELPFGKGKPYGANTSRFVQAILGNWQVNGILSLRTGQPFTLNASGCQLVSDGALCGPQLISGNANAAPPGGRSPNEWFNTANFGPPAPLSQGNLGLQTNTGPPTKTLDFSIFKDFPFTERWRLEFRSEFFNIFNNPQFNIQDLSNNLSNSNFGQITGTLSGSERHIQFSARLMF
ncbi:MAG: carboxypeptidase regulatory-like domain-containing protein [Acidobacteriaceae bacterium]|nr:carboxypeptidase regulatory-like domain-containing protein [Acidobacteriaceae bacterium]